MTQAPRGPVVIDTGVFGAQLTPRTWPLGELYRPLVERRPALISFITVAELRFGARLAAWGPRRLGRLERELERAETIWPGPDLTGTYAALRAWCVKNGHGLGQKEHEADRWVAATAIWLDVPLVAHDAIFADVGASTCSPNSTPRSRSPCN
jgi:predicted nucleic acid-binding protein